MVGWVRVVIVGVLFSAASDASAQELVSRCGTEVAAPARVVRVVDGRSLVMEDGREIRLASLEVPAATEPAGIAARAALASLVHGKTIGLHHTTAGPDRYGRISAYAFTTDERGTQWVPHRLLSQGHARVGAQVDDPACAAELLSQESVARAAGIGLWTDPDYAIIKGGDLTGLTTGVGRFVVVEGRVASVRDSGGTTYVNFGRRWSQALTVTILKRDQRMFADAGLNPKSLESRHLRVRGWVELRNGPRIEVSRPEQIEFVRQYWQY